MTESYRAIYRISVKHDYFTGTQPPLLRLHLSHRGEMLARSFGMLFRQTGCNEWTLVRNVLGPQEAVTLELEMTVVDSRFWLYTAWDGFSPLAVYKMSLPGSSEVVLPASAACAEREVVKDGNRKCLRKKAKGRGTALCTILLHIGTSLTESSRQGRPAECVLRFRALEQRWEYVFIPSDEEKDWDRGMELIDQTKTMNFTGKLKKGRAFGKEVWRTTVKRRVPMRSSYPCKLKLQQIGGKKRVLLSHIEPPEPGRFQDAPKGFIRQVCYY